MALHRPEREVGDLGDLGMAASFVESHSQESACRFPQSRDFIGDHEAVGESVDPDPAVVLDKRPGCSGLVRLLGTTPPGVGDDVPGDPDEPSTERTDLGPEARSAAPGGQEDLLGDVGRLVGGAERAQGERVDERAVALIEPLERVVVAADEADGRSSASGCSTSETLIQRDLGSAAGAAVTTRLSRYPPCSRS